MSSWQPSGKLIADPTIWSQMDQHYRQVWVECACVRTMMVFQLLFEQYMSTHATDLNQKEHT